MSTPLTKNAVPRTYAELRSRVEQTLLTGQRLIERAKKRTYWETGRLIKEHLLFHADRAPYGTQVIPRLARDLEVSDRVLYQCLQFARTYPILHDRAEFSWAHYRVLIQISDPAQRRLIEAQARKHAWPSPLLEARVRELSLLNAPAGNGGNGHSSDAPPSPKLLVPQRGTPGLFRLVARGDRLAADLGFRIYRPLDPDEAVRHAPGDIVQLDGRGTITRAPGATKADLFTYAATIRRAIDGDTFVIEIELLPRCVVEQKLRLRGIDCPEVATSEGRAAKRCTDAALSAATAVTLHTTKPDKYDRYLADVFLTTADGDLFLNNELLSRGHADRKDAWAFGDWGDPLGK